MTYITHHPISSSNIPTVSLSSRLDQPQRLKCPHRGALAAPKDGTIGRRRLSVSTSYLTHQKVDEKLWSNHMI